MRFYVYALIAPADHNRPFYIGKGLSGRLQSHFTNHATSGEISTLTEVVGCDTASLVADAKEHLPDRKGERLARLISRGYTHQDIARVIARRVSEPIAFALESFSPHPLEQVGGIRSQNLPQNLSFNLDALDLIWRLEACAA